jgi:linoleoyl-CoA desaturase
MHIMTGNLSYQIEHHLYPDLPSNRYQEIAPRIRDLFQRYGLTYTSGPLPKQVGSAWAKVFRLALPNRGEAKALADGPRPVSARKVKAIRWQRAGAPVAQRTAAEAEPVTARS